MKPNEPSVSIIMNCFNSDQFLAEAIDSVFAQTFKNWEIVFWDNNSNDKSAEIAQSYGRNLKYYKTDQTSTLYTARNLALEKCSGNYIAFIDCDDIWTKEKLEKQMELVLSGYDIVYGGYDTIDSNGDKLSDELKYLISGNITNALFKRNSISIGCIVIKKSLLIHTKFDPFYDLLGDYDLWVRLSLKNPIAAVPFLVEHSRQHGTNMSGMLNNKWLLERRYFYRKYLNLGNLIRYPWLVYYIFKTELLGLTGKR